MESEAAHTLRREPEQRNRTEKRERFITDRISMAKPSNPALREQRAKPRL
jgi:hypothetical protein